MQLTKEKTFHDEKVELLLTELENNHIPYDIVYHEEVISMEEYDDVEKYFHQEVIKNLFLCNRQETMFYLLLMPKDKKFKTKELSAQINSARLSFAKEEYLHQFLNCKMGSTSILGLYFDHQQKVKLLLDKDLMDRDIWLIHPCDNRASIFIRRGDVLHFIQEKSKHNYQEVELFGLD